MPRRPFFAFSASSGRQQTPVLLLSFALTLSLVAPTAASAGEKLNQTDFKNFCGYLIGLERDARNPKRECTGKCKRKVADLKRERSRLKKVAPLLRTSWKKLKASVEKAKKVGATCEEVGKVHEDKTQKALAEAFGKRVAIYVLDYNDPDFVVASITWRGGNKKKLEEEASLIAAIVTEHAPITKTIALRAISPRGDPADKKAIWFDGKINPARASRIDKKRIDTDADRRYIGLFDDVVKVDPITAKLMKYDSRKRKWVEAPPPKPDDAKKDG